MINPALCPNGMVLTYYSSIFSCPGVPIQKNESIYGEHSEHGGFDEIEEIGEHGERGVGKFGEFEEPSEVHAEREQLETQHSF